MDRKDFLKKTGVYLAGKSLGIKSLDDLLGRSGFRADYRISFLKGIFPLSFWVTGYVEFNRERKKYSIIAETTAGHPIVKTFRKSVLLNVSRVSGKINESIDGLVLEPSSMQIFTKEGVDEVSDREKLFENKPSSSMTFQEDKVEYNDFEEGISASVYHEKERPVDPFSAIIQLTGTEEVKAINKVNFDDKPSLEIVSLTSTHSENEYFIRNESDASFWGSKGIIKGRHSEKRYENMNVPKNLFVPKYEGSTEEFSRINVKMIDFKDEV